MVEGESGLMDGGEGMLPDEGNGGLVDEVEDGLMNEVELVDDGEVSLLSFSRVHTFIVILIRTHPSLPQPASDTHYLTLTYPRPFILHIFFFSIFSHSTFLSL